MNTSSEQANLAQAINFLGKMLHQQAPSKSLEWLKQQQEKIKEQVARSFYMAFSMASRYFESQMLTPDASQLAEADQLRKGFMPQYWTKLQAARTILLLSLAQQQQKENFINSLSLLTETADVAEQTALYAALPLLPYPHELRKQTAEGLRTNITLVFDAIALHNPYPAEYLEEGPWNQLLLKAVFIQRPLYQIQGTGTRVNPVLAQMLLDLVHERWAAGRSVSPELWQFIGPYLQKESFSDIEKVIREGTQLERDAVLLACAASTLPQAAQLLRQYPDVVAKIKNDELSWNSIGKRHNSTTS